MERKSYMFKGDANEFKNALIAHQVRMEAIDSSLKYECSIKNISDSNNFKAKLWPKSKRHGLL
ncbi:MAG: hypothetical protein KDE46_29105, partial [Caldilineaceae bacterium]|nr:hypothetical protein [Caldilineaceae bacterium]